MKIENIKLYLINADTDERMGIITAATEQEAIDLANVQIGKADKEGVNLYWDNNPEYAGEEYDAFPESKDYSVKA